MSGSPRVESKRETAVFPHQTSLPAGSAPASWTHLPACPSCVFIYVCTHRAHVSVFPFLQELLQLEDRLGNVTRGAVQNTIERFTFPHKYKKVRLHRLQPSAGGKGVVCCLLEPAWLSAGDTIQSPGALVLVRCSTAGQAPQDFLIGPHRMQSGGRVGGLLTGKERRLNVGCSALPCT